MMQPPKPPPVIRAPSAPALPGGLDGQVDRRHGDLEVVPHRGVRGVQQRSQVRDPARAQHVGGLQHPGVLGHHVPDPAAHHLVGQPAQGGVEVGHVAQRRHPEQPAASSQLRRRVAYSLSTRACGVLVSSTSSSSPARPGPARPARPRWCGSRRTARARPCTGSTPPGPSGRSAPRRTRSRPAGPAGPARSGRSSPLRSTSAVSTAHSSAAEEDSPAPIGTSEESTRSAPSTRCPASLQRPDHPGDVGLPAGHARVQLVAA